MVLLFWFLNADILSLRHCVDKELWIFALGNEPERTVYNTGYVTRAEKIPTFAPASILHADCLAEITHKKPNTVQYTSTGPVC